MPNRIIHEKALRSHTLGRLSAEAERLFWRLTVVADDQGRFDAYPQTVKSDCFPTLIDSIPTKKVLGWLEELGKECCYFYTVDGRPYGYFIKWSEYQRIYGNKTKFPQPPAECGNSPQSPALILIPTPITTSTSTSISIGGEPSPEAQVRKGRLDRSNETACKPSLTLDDFKLTPELEAWSAKEGIPNPEQYVEEFKDYWRSAGGKRKNGQPVKDWAAAFRNRLRTLQEMGKLKTKKPDVFEAFLTQHEQGAVL